MQDDFLLESYDYHLPQQNIAQHPAERRDCSKLLVLNQATSTISHKQFSDITDYFKPGDILVVNDTRVFPARLNGRKTTGGKVEVFLLGLPPATNRKSSQHSSVETTALLKSSKKPAVNSTLHITDELRCTVLEHFDYGKAKVLLEFPHNKDLTEILSQCGSVPLPPYIERLSGNSSEDRERYQTVYAKKSGAVAAPTAGLHFTEEILATLKKKGVDIVTLTLHVGYGTFAPVRVEEINKHEIHSEYIELLHETAKKINQAKQAGCTIWAVGTTTVRTLEYCCNASGVLKETKGWCDLYITPGYTFRVIDNLITNFHLPKSSLLFLVSAFCGREKLLSCYNEAIAMDYRFYSYGDAMAIIS